MTRAPVGLVFAYLLLGCGSETPSENPNTGGAPAGGAGNSGGVSGSASGSGPTGGAGVAGNTSGGTGGASGSAGAPGGSGGTAPMWGIETRPTGQTCVLPADRNAAPTLLSATGCVDPMDPKQPARTLIPYGVASALWSDAATKHRYFALPDNTTINVKECPRDAAQCAPVEEGGGYEEPGDWIFPIGTVFVKTFIFGERIVETRLLMRAGEYDYWGYSYEWRADQTDADLIPADGAFIAGKDVMIEGPNGMQTWHFPARSECGTCHTTPAGTSLGPETQQLNTDYTYPNGVTGNQIETLDRIGIFTASPADMPGLPNPADTSLPLEERARSYMHANCSMCHRPGSTFTGFDARFSVPFADMQLCNVTPEKGNLGVMNAMRITPGDPMASVVSLRMHTRDLAMMPSVQMPIVATNVVDDAGVGVIDDWIESLTGCP